MLAPLRKVLTNPVNISGIMCMLILMLFHEATSMYYYLTIAQLVYVPIVLQQVVEIHKWQKVCIVSGQVAVTLLFFVEHPLFSLVSSTVYILTTIAIAWIGIHRFLQRGFTNVAELLIDIGLIYMLMGGIWFFAHVNQIYTGFSPTITWLTAIHFHYSAYLLCITVGLIGRLHSSRYFTYCAAVIAAGPMLVAIGITFSHVIEIISVSLYVIAIFSLTFYSFWLRLPYIASTFLRLAFVTLSVTIIWSFLYAYSNLTGSGLVTIPDMLAFHGILNCILFGGAITIAFTFYIPKTTCKPFTFPKSKIRNHVIGLLEPHNALVDEMDIYINKATIPTQISNFYENTTAYELTASVKWSTWFKPFAFVFHMISKRIGQLNLPLTSNNIKMDGTITKVDANVDGRQSPRIWQRQVNGQTIFSAIYAVHRDDQRAYMNIALPLPKSVMHGILTLRVKNNKLYLTSDDEGDAGTYMTFGSYTFKLPLHEYFVLSEQDGQLTATHTMKLFGIRFLTIHYWIQND